MLRMYVEISFPNKPIPILGPHLVPTNVEAKQ
jgi:hypothetical protein